MTDVTRRNKRNKRIGADYEIDLTEWLRAKGYKAERLVKRGTKDEGDISIDLGDFTLVIEAKNEKAIDLAGYVSESQVEAGHYAAARGMDESAVFPVVAIKRRMKGIDKSYAVVELETLLRLIGL